MFSSLAFCEDGQASQPGLRPGQVLIEQLLPLLRLIAAKYASCDQEVVSNLAECIRKAVPVLEFDSQCSILCELLTMCGALLMQHPNAAVLNAVTSVRLETLPAMSLELSYNRV